MPDTRPSDSLEVLTKTSYHHVDPGGGGLYPPGRRGSWPPRNVTEAASGIFVATDVLFEEEGQEKEPDRISNRPKLRKEGSKNYAQMWSNSF